LNQLPRGGSHTHSRPTCCQNPVQKHNINAWGKIHDNGYLNLLPQLALTRPEYIRIKIINSPEEIINEYNLRNKVTESGHVYIEANKGMYGLPQAGLIANELLEKQLNKHGYCQSKLIPGLWTHDTHQSSSSWWLMTFV
jgi:hypothetical protein